MLRPYKPNELNDADTGFPWYAVQVQTNFERTTQTLLNQKGFECYVPACADLRKWSDRVKSVDVPLFPGYVFCRLDLDHRLAILTTPRVYGLVGAGRTPSAIDESEIDAVRRAAESRREMRPHPYVRVGEKVRVDRGPLAGVEGILLRTKGQFRLLLSIELLQQSVVVDVDRDCVSPGKMPVPDLARFASLGAARAMTAAR